MQNDEEHSTGSRGAAVEMSCSGDDTDESRDICWDGGGDHTDEQVARGSKSCSCVEIASSHNHRFMRLRNRDWKRRSDVNSNAYKPREALRVRSKKLIFGLIFGLCGLFAGKLKALQEIQPAFQTQCALFSVMVKA